MSKRFYCYALFDTDGPFYIGKGTGHRDIQHLQPSTYTQPRKRLYQHIRKLIEAGTPPTLHRLTDDNLTEDDAFAIECFLILAIGRRGCKYNPGPLLNETDGGDGLDHRSAKAAKERQQAKNIRKAAVGLPRNKYTSRPWGRAKYWGVRECGLGWRAEIHFHRRTIRGLTRYSIEEAARDYDELARQYFGVGARQNFPNEVDPPPD